MNDSPVQLTLGREFVSEKQIVKEYFAQFGRVGGKSTSPAKVKASRANIRIANAVRILKAHEGKKAAI